jgi:hypothetical protein
MSATAKKNIAEAARDVRLRNLAAGGPLEGKKMNRDKRGSSRMGGINGGVYYRQIDMTMELSVLTVLEQIFVRARGVPEFPLLGAEQNSVSRLLTSAVSKSWTLGDREWCCPMPGLPWGRS